MSIIGVTCTVIVLYLATTQTVTKGSEACDSSPCLHNATCVDDDGAAGNYTCHCVGPYVGPNCESYNCSTTNNPCANNGVCESCFINNNSCSSSGDAIGRGFACVCPDGRFEGVLCDVDVDECATTLPCPNGTTCNNTYGGYECLCRAGETSCSASSSTTMVPTLAPLTSSFVVRTGLRTSTLFQRGVTPTVSPSLPATTSPIAPTFVLAASATPGENAETASRDVRTTSFSFSSQTPNDIIFVAPTSEQIAFSSSSSVSTSFVSPSQTPAPVATAFPLPRPLVYPAGLADELFGVLNPFFLGIIAGAIIFFILLFIWACRRCIRNNSKRKHEAEILRIKEALALGPVSARYAVDGPTSKDNSRAASAVPPDNDEHIMISRKSSRNSLAGSVVSVANPIAAAADDADPDDDEHIPSHTSFHGSSRGTIPRAITMPAGSLNDAIYVNRAAVMNQASLKGFPRRPASSVFRIPPPPPVDAMSLSTPLSPPPGFGPTFPPFPSQSNLSYSTAPPVVVGLPPPDMRRMSMPVGVGNGRYSRMPAQARSHSIDVGKDNVIYETIPHLNDYRSLPRGGVVKPPEPNHPPEPDHPPPPLTPDVQRRFAPRHDDETNFTA